MLSLIRWYEHGAIYYKFSKGEAFAVYGVCYRNFYRSVSSFYLSVEHNSAAIYRKRNKSLSRNLHLYCYRSERLYNYCFNNSYAASGSFCNGNFISGSLLWRINRKYNMYSNGR